MDSFALNPKPQAVSNCSACGALFIPKPRRPVPRGQRRVENVGVDVQRVGGDAKPAGQKLADMKLLKSFGLRSQVYGAVENITNMHLRTTCHEHDSSDITAPAT